MKDKLKNKGVCNMKKEIIKVVGNVVISGSVGTVIGHAVGAVMPPQIKTAQKVASLVGGCIISQYVTGKIAKEFENKVDEIFDGIEEVEVLEPNLV